MNDQMCVTLPTLHLGSPTQVGPLTLFPVWADAPLRANPIPLGPPAGATVGELDTPTVALLAATNPTGGLFALLEGTVVDGGWQHRVLIQSVLVGAGVTVRTGCGIDTATDLHWCNEGSAVWNNSGDTAFLLDPSGNVVDSVDG